MLSNGPHALLCLFGGLMAFRLKWINFKQCPPGWSGMAVQEEHNSAVFQIIQDCRHSAFHSLAAVDSWYLVYYRNVWQVVGLIISTMAVSETTVDSLFSVVFLQFSCLPLSYMACPQHLIDQVLWTLHAQCAQWDTHTCHTQDITPLVFYITKIWRDMY